MEADFGPEAFGALIDSFNQLKNAATEKQEKLAKSHTKSTSLYLSKRACIDLKKGMEGGINFSTVAPWRFGNFLYPYLNTEPVFKGGNFMCRYTPPWHWWAFIWLPENEAQKVREVSTADFELSHFKKPSLLRATVLCLP